MSRAPADWELPPGVNRGLWDYLHDRALAANYDASLEGNPLPAVDEEFVERHHRAGGRLLDLGCGTGRLLLRLARAGSWVVGVDLSPEMLAVARRTAGEAGLGVHLLRANLVQLDALADGSFDTVACLFSTLGMVLGAENRRRAVAHAHQVLRPGGRFVLHVHNRWHELWNGAGRRRLLGDLWSRGRETGDRVMPAHQGLAGLTLHLFTRGEVLRLLREAGFKVAEVRALGLDGAGRVVPARWPAGLRAYGFLVAAVKGEA